MSNERRPSESLSSQRGYSLIELLVVVAIVGVLSLVMVPNFMSLYQSNRMKSAMRQFTSDVRGARQEAVTSYRFTKISIVPGTGTYRIEASPDLGTTWNVVSEKTMMEPITFASTTFLDGDGDDDPEFIFRNNGTTATAGTIVIETEADIPNNSITIEINTVGTVKTI
ncbi:MAG TPA: GspH/FimT family pseudopilin [Thermoanaerobaculia bacterium]|nr:GspH/FimT family pseudopilin [Thermoanaerobaculia bacterium]